MDLFVKIVLKNGVILENVVKIEEGATKEEVAEDIDTINDSIAEGLRSESTGGISIGDMLINIQEIAAIEMKIMERAS